MFSKKFNKFIILTILLYLGFFSLIAVSIINTINIVNASPANGDSGDTGSGDSAGSSGGDYSGGNGDNDGGYGGGGNGVDGGSGGGSNQNHTGDEGNNSGGDGGYGGGSGGGGGGGGGPKTLSGYVYNDINQNAVFDSGDSGLVGETIQIIRPAYTVPAYTTGGYCDVSSTDENGNPTGETCYPLVSHPAVYNPDLVVVQGNTDTGGHYAISGITPGAYKIHHTREPLWSGWVRTTPNDVSITLNVNRVVSFGMVSNIPSNFKQSAPIPSCPAPNNSQINLDWEDSVGASNYIVYYTTPSGGLYGGWPTGGPSQYNVTSGLTPGGQYSFIIAATNGTPPDVSSDTAASYPNGQWSHEKFGTFTTFPDCVPPGAFSLTSGPTANCPAVDSPNVTLSWGPPGSSGATNYHVLYRDTANLVTQEFPSPWYVRGSVFSETVTGLTKGNNYGFLIAATKHTNIYNPFQAYSGNWTDVTPGATTYPDCDLPIVNLFLTSPDYNNGTRKPYNDPPPMSLKQTQSATISWETSNANTNCTASIPPQLLGSGKPTPANIISAWSGSKPNSGSQALPQLITTGTYPFTLTCYNPWNNNLTTSSRINLIIEPLQKPYIQTTGGSVHTNESIYIPQN